MTTTVDQITQRRRGVGLIAHDPKLSAGGYTLIAPQTAGGRVYLVDIGGEVVHEWQMPVRPGRHAVILPNGNLGYNGNHADSEDRYAPWSMWHGGDFYEVTPGGEVVWRYEDPAHHHDAQWLPNGNLLYAACAPVPAGFADRVPGGTAHGPEEVMYGDVIREVNRAGELVWEWKAWEHLNPQDFPIAPGFGRYHWPLVNGLGVNAQGEVLMSLRTTSGIIAVDRETGAVQTHIPPSVVSHQHAPVALANGNILTFDNGNFRAGAHVVFSRVLEIDPVSREVVWSYADDMVNMFYSAFMGNAQRLANGNTHITESATGRLFEVTPAGEVVWEYVIPWFGEYPDEAARKTGPGQLNSVFQTFRYSREQLPWLRA
ncbi:MULTISPECIES: aryl-sulfate sulfotransferase [unclassified Paraburkholderia]|uniref:aryl-sulfate sulfotransferase n=1 Tax=unclassified Paraburkholderia TaxID=2615204 RepID=UPI000E266731|nr:MULTISPECIES: aryl-sulfate sulfotransferase [unclassified Paraburkholderia]REE22231.1 arylsulfotransferase ASST [Paraburkholderia sp. BL27I4N3]RKR36421.1 arylsulfotransferase ASST [Paraburkholderia sp. BL17N1]